MFRFSKVLKESLSPKYIKSVIRRNYSVIDKISEKDAKILEKIRNIGISAHIDSGKTTLTERILFYTGKIGKIHDVKGSDGVGAKMDSMDLEREKGITIKSAATYCEWGKQHINIIDTPGHVDFTMEVERSLRVLDGAVLVLCGVGGVQSQTFTVDRQMRRYNVPRICFINKLDRLGADDNMVIEQMRKRLGLHVAACQIPIGYEDSFRGLVDVIEMRSIFFEGGSGEKIVYKDVPEDLVEKANEKRRELIEKLADVDPEIEEKFLMEEEPTTEEIYAAIRRSVIANKFIPVYMGSAKMNTGVQCLLDAIVNYLPAPLDVSNYAFNMETKEKVEVLPDSTKPFAGLAFKLEDGKFGQLTWIRIYQGTLKRGDTIFNQDGKKKIKLPRLVRLHSDEMEEIKSIGPGEICAMFGVDCSSGDTFVSTTKSDLLMEAMHVPKPVISMSMSLKDHAKEMAFAKALNRFQKEDPTFRVTLDEETNQTVMHGMGELHLFIHAERLKREYDCDVILGQPNVAYREAITKPAKFDYLHKKQSGGSGQYARVIGHIELLPEDSEKKFEFCNDVIGNNIPPNFIISCEKGFNEVQLKGPQLDSPVWGVRVCLTDGVTHSVDSSELAFKTACWNAFRQAVMAADPIIIEPVMNCEISIPAEYQGQVIGGINKRRGTISSTDEIGGFLVIYAVCPLAEMFGYMTELRSQTQGKGEFSMEYFEHQPSPPDVQARVIQEYKDKRTKK